MTIRNIIYNILIALAGGVTALYAYSMLNKEVDTYTYFHQELPVARFAEYSNLSNSLPDFRSASKKTINAVVHIKTYIENEGEENKYLFDFFFGSKSGKFHQDNSFATGSGVIVSHDGFILTNNHVIENSEKVEVVLNDKRSYKAQKIGADPFTDIALLKIDAEELPFLNFGNSDSIYIGDWVIAVGNPFNLTSTVTAGIISAKGRNINILSRENAIEAFIQTDAAVNPGNSGGALVDVYGNLIGINTAIASRTGYFAGYSFAVPSLIVEKVYDDIKKYGEVQRALLGVKTIDVDASFAKQKKLSIIEGVCVTDVYNKSAAEEAGVQIDDVIIKISGVAVNSAADLHSQMSRFSPGESVVITVKRDEKIIDFNVVLKSRNGDTNIIVPDLTKLLGASFSELTGSEKTQLKIAGGVKVIEIKAGKLLNKGVKSGFIITAVDEEEVKSINDLYKKLKGKKGGVLLSGMYPNGEREYYAFGMR